MFDRKNLRYAKFFLRRNAVTIILNSENSFTEDAVILQEEINNVFREMGVAFSVEANYSPDGNIDKFTLRNVNDIGKCNFAGFMDRLVSGLRVGELLVYFCDKKN
ncbi:MAG: hypothetical protein Q8L10_00340 [Candidatus Moranbacteria bacterium]|nr:hypothetical protein [Candidatus Moranbacteria bacterium]